MPNRSRNLDDYVDVATRIQHFYKKYPDGSLQSSIVHDDGKRIVMRALAYRKPDDPSPGVGHAEEIRGDGPVNRTSALENSETSAWGRALAALGFEVRNGVASREEMEQAKAEEERQKREGSKANGRISPDHAQRIKARVKQHGMEAKELRLALGAAGADSTDLRTAIDNLTAQQAEKLEELLS